MRRLLVVVGLMLAFLAPTGSAPAADPPSAGNDGYVAPVCGDPDVATLAGVDCAGEDGVPSLDPADQANPPTVDSLAAEAAAKAAADPLPDPAFCREHVNVLFYTSNDWVRLGQKLLADQSPCADYYITLPPLAADKTAPRCLQDDLIRALGPRFHPVAEFHFSGWNAWRNQFSPPKTFTDAAREFQRKWGACGYDLWSLNEMHSGVRRNLPGARQNMIELLDALAAGGYGMPTNNPGIAWVIGVGQNTVNVSDYKPQLQAWLQDGAFWSAIKDDIWAWGQEAYPDMRYWGVADVSRHERTSNLTDFLEHFMFLAENGPASVQPALDFLEETYMALGSAAFPVTTGSGFGNTAFSDDQMERFVAEQTFAVKHYAISRPHRAPDSRIAFAWAPPTGGPVCPNLDVPGTVKPCDAKKFAQITGAVLDRLASSIHYAYDQGDNSQEGACGPPGDHTWCSADIANAAFNPLWLIFPDWPGTPASG